MERAVALKKLRKILGKNAAWEINPKAASGEERAAAQAEQPRLQAERKAAGEALTARMQELLKNDEEYQALRARAEETRKALDANSGILFLHKICVGTVNGMFFHVDAQGDSWEQIFELLAKKKKGGA